MSDRVGRQPNRERSAAASGDAVVVGNRAGVVEWANEGWARLTGRPAKAALEKPLGALLEQYGVDPGAVSWVGRRFRDGYNSDLELPIVSPEGQRRWLRVRVEALRDDAGDVSQFVATARDISTSVEQAPELEVNTADASELALRAARTQSGELGDRVAFDLALASDLPPVYVDEEKVVALVQHLIRCGRRAIDDTWGTLTLSTGVVGLGAAPMTSLDPTARLPVGPYVFLEVHDTGLCDPESAEDRVLEPFLPAAQVRVPGDAADGRRLPAGQALCRELGGDLVVESLRWWGTAALLVLPA